jgi:hypothetical protein
MASVSRIDFDKIFIERLPDNSEGQIQPSDLRTILDALSDSVLWYDEASSGPAGASAYDVAVSAGFSGAEADWLSSLTGAAGQDGAQGPEGPKGDTGPAGADGRAIAGVRMISVANHTVGEPDDGSLLQFTNATGASVVLPSDTAAPLRIGTIVHLLQSDIGVVSVVGSKGVAVDLREGFLPETCARDAIITVIKTAQNRWRVVGECKLAPGVLANMNGGALSAVRTTNENAPMLELADTGGLVVCSADSAVTVVIPAEADAEFVIGAAIHIAQGGSGPVSLQPAAGVTLLRCSTKSLALSGENSLVTLFKTAPDVWRVSGDLAIPHAFA